MRIISGDKRGMTILSPRDQTTRPMPDRVKAALFSILGGTLPPRPVADVFSGTGSFGLEALSRGASRCWFFERDRDAVGRLRANLEKMELVNQAVVVPGDVFRAGFPPVEANLGEAATVSLDPPYRVLEPGRLREEFRGLLAKLAGSGRTDADTVTIVRHERKLSVPCEETGWLVADARTYGGMTLTFLRRPGAAVTDENSSADEPAEQ